MLYEYQHLCIFCSGVHPSQSIGVSEHLRENPWCHGKVHGVNRRFSQTNPLQFRSKRWAIEQWFPAASSLLPTLRAPVSPPEIPNGPLPSNGFLGVSTIGAVDHWIYQIIYFKLSLTSTRHGVGRPWSHHDALREKWRWWYPIINICK